MHELSDTEQKIVDAAAIEFLEKGIAGARTQAIADKAGINKALLHYYFRSKEKLYEIVAERVIRRVMSQIIGNISTEADFKTWLQQFIHNYLTTISGNPMITRFMLWEIEAGGSRIAQIVREIFGAHEVKDNPLYIAVNKAVEEGKIRPVDPIQFIISMLAACIFPFVARPILEKLVPGLDVRSQGFIQQREEAIMDLFWNGIRLAEDGNEPPSEIETKRNNWLFW